jgi:hypothetical protein
MQRARHGDLLPGPFLPATASSAGRDEPHRPGLREERCKHYVLLQLLLHLVRLGPAMPHDLPAKSGFTRMAWQLRCEVWSIHRGIEMRAMHFMRIAALAMMPMLNGCAPTAPDSSAAHGGGATTTPKAQDDLRPTKLENCVTAVGADRSRCSATN